MEIMIDELAREGGYLDRLQGLIGVKVSHAGSDKTSRPKASSKPPWAPQHALPYFDIVAAAVRLEAKLRENLIGKPVKARPFTHSAARKALQELPMLAEKSGEDVEESTRRTVGYWVRMAKTAPGIAETRDFMRLQATCPFCGEPELWVARDASSAVTCRTTDCIDPDTGSRPTWPKNTWLTLLASMQDRHDGGDAQ